MRLDEHDAKTLLAEHGVETPRGVLAASAQQAAAAALELVPPLYIKALTPSTSRAARGGVARIDAADQAGDAFTAVTSAMDVAEVRIETAVAGDEEWFVALGFFPGRDRPSVMLARSGGSGIESRADAVREVAFDPLLGLRPFHARRLLEGFGLSRAGVDAFADVLARLHRVFATTDALLVEVNPLLRRGDAFVALDARIEIDDFARFRQPELWATRSARANGDVTGLHEHGIDYVQLDGRIGIIGLGAGLTMLLADWVEQEGGSPAFFCDLTVAAVRDWAALFAGEFPAGFARAAGHAVDHTRDRMDVLLVNFTSGGTPVDGLMTGLFSELDARGPDVPVVAHAAGNRGANAARLLDARGVVPQPSLGAAVRAAVAADRSLR